MGLGDAVPATVSELARTPMFELLMVSLYMNRTTPSPFEVVDRTGKSDAPGMASAARSRIRARPTSGWTNTAAWEKLARLESEIVSAMAELNWVLGVCPSLVVRKLWGPVVGMLLLVSMIPPPWIWIEFMYEMEALSIRLPSRGSSRFMSVSELPPK
jgi:hypothetical protein